MGISLFGAPRVEKDGQPVALHRSKGLALLAYLAVTQTSHSRDSLLDLLWPLFAPHDARNNLRRELSLLRKTLDSDILLVDRAQIGLNMQRLDADEVGNLVVDVRRFEGLLDAANHHSDGSLCPECAESLRNAVALYTGDFLAGFSLPDSPLFDEWQFFQTERLRGLLGGALDRLTEWEREIGNLETAIEYVRRRLALDPLLEPAHRALMRLYAESSQDAAALRQYEKTRMALRAELDIDPEPETTELYEAIRGRRLTAKGVTLAVQIGRGIDPPNTPIPVALPADTTPFIGRERELEHLDRLLAGPDARLVTIFGIGGMGKTRLALAAARRAAGTLANNAFADGVFFVSLASVSRSADIASALAYSLGFTPGGIAEQARQLITFLTPLHALLVIDNLEHLVDSQSAAFFGDLLATAPGVKLLTTSRVRIGLSSEYIFPLEGLDLSDSPENPAKEQLDNSNGRIDHTATSDSVRLFVMAAHRVQPAFQLNRDNVRVVTRICRLVEGMPLGIELAAGWLEMLTPEAILEEIEGSLDFLSSSHADIPARQASLKAVFDSSWRLLTQEEQTVMSRLCVFPGSFDRAAAEAIAGASLRMLLSLSNKSWLQSAGANRFRIHELLRQYAGQESGSDVAVETVRDRHANYYAQFLANLEGQMKGRQPSAGFDALTAELGNVQEAMAWLIAHDQIGALVDQMAPSLMRYLESRYRYFLFEPLLIEAKRHANRLGLIRERSILLTMQAAFFFNGYPTRFMDYHWVGPDWRDAMVVAWGLSPDARSSTDFWNILLAWQYGRFVDVGVGVDRLRELLAQSERSGRRWEGAFARQSLGRLLSRRPWDPVRYGRAGEAKELLQTAQRWFEELGDEREAAVSLIFLGFERQSENDLVESRHILLEAQERLQSLGEEIIAANLNWQLGEIHLSLGEMETGLSYFHEMAEILLRHGLVQLASPGLSRESYETVRYGDLERALRLRERSLALSIQTGWRFNEGWDYWEMGNIYRLMGQRAEARRLFERSRLLFHEINTNAGESFYYRGLGDLELDEGNYVAAETHFLESIDWAEKTIHSWQHAYALAGLGRALTGQGRVAEAKSWFAQALRIGLSTGDGGGLVMDCVAGIAYLYERTENLTRAIELAGIVLSHSMSWQETRQEATTILELLPEAMLEMPSVRGVELAQFVEELVGELEARESPPI